MKNKNKSKSIILIVCLALIMIGVLVAYFILKNPADTSSRDGTATSFTKNERPSSSTAESDKSQSSGGSNGNTSNESVPLVKPYGSFVSNHSPNLSGTPAPADMQSTCITSAGASCTILFKKGSTTLSLTAKATDASGYAFWSWNVKELGLTEGSWTITAVATSGSQSLSTIDQNNLEVSR